MSQGLGELDVQRTLVLAAGGDASAWEQLVGAYTGRVYAMALRRCGDAELAEEITQGTFVKVVEHLARYQERGKFEAWLFRIALNLLRDQMRQRKRRGISGVGWQGDEDQEPAWAMGQTDEEAGPMQTASRREMVEKVREAVGMLGEADQEVLMLRHTAGLSFGEIAKVLDEPLGTVLARGHRALGKLRKMLGAEVEP